MIPASYMFKQVYDHAWNEADALPATEHRTRFLDGLGIPVAGAITALLHFRPAPTYHAGRHAWQ